MTNPRLAKSLVQLRAQINAAFPGRDKSSDGWIGDTSHSTRKSDHNPNAKGVVTAIDIDEDLAPSINSIESVVSSIRASRDPRVKYIIYEGRITVEGSDLQRWKKYTGANAHSHHAHVSVSSDPKLYDDARPWAVFVEPEKASVATPAKVIKTSPLQSPSQPTDILPEIRPLPTEPVALPPIEVPQISAAVDEPKPKDEGESKLISIGNKATALWASIGATVVAIGTFLTSTPLGIAISIIASIAVIAAIYMIVNAARQSGKEKRDAAEKLALAQAELELKKQRETQAFELQLATIKAAADPNMHTVTIKPPSIEMPNSDAPADASEGK